MEVTVAQSGNNFSVIFKRVVISPTPDLFRPD